MFRLEGELGYKHAKVKSFGPSDAFVTAINTGAGTTFVSTNDFGLADSASVYSGMVNALLDLGGNGGIGGYVGAGAGYANVKQFGDSHGGFAWQLIAGAYAPVSSNIDIGLKYRFFRGPSSSASETFVFPAGTAACGTAASPFTCSGGTATFFNDSRFSSHSLLASLIYSFGSAAAAASAAPAAAAATAAGSRNADLSGRFGDRSDGHLPGAASAAAPAACTRSAGRTRQIGKVHSSFRWPGRS